MGNLFKKLALLLPIPLFVIMLNYTVDPAHIFVRGNYEQGVARLLLAGRNVADIGDHDERLVQRYYVEGLSQKKDVIVLGSSRAMFIRSSFFPGSTFFNSSLSAATLEDFMAVYGVYRRCTKLPRTIILCVDPWILDSEHIYNSYHNWDSLPEEFRSIELLVSSSPKLLPELRITTIRTKQLETLVSAPYFLESFKFWIKGKRNFAYGTDAIEIDDGLKLADGSLILSRQDRSKTVSQVLTLATSLNVREMRPFQVDTIRKEMFEAFVRLMTHDGVKVSLFLAPYHPRTYEFISTSKKLNEMQRYFVQFAKTNNMVVVGSYNPVESGCGEEDFDDSSHPKVTCIEKVFLKGSNTGK